MQIDFEKMGGLAPAIVQDADNGEVLMVGFMNQEALDKWRLGRAPEPPSPFGPEGEEGFVNWLNEPMGQSAKQVTRYMLAVREDAECRFMKLTTLEKVRDSLRDGKHRITVEAQLAERARLAIERMVAIGS